LVFFVERVIDRAEGDELVAEKDACVEAKKLGLKEACCSVKQREIADDCVDVSRQASRCFPEY
jgi:hypothetical protein